MSYTNSNPPRRFCRSGPVWWPSTDQSGAGGLPWNHPARERTAESDLAQVSDCPLQVHQRRHRVPPPILAESSAGAGDAQNHRWVWMFTPLLFFCLCWDVQTWFLLCYYCCSSRQGSNSLFLSSRCFLCSQVVTLWPPIRPPSHPVWQGWRCVLP